MNRNSNALTAVKIPVLVFWVKLCVYLYINTGCSKSHATHGEMQYKFNFFYYYYAYFLVLKMSTITLFTEMHTTNHVSEHVLQCSS
jgi:hypothetical protein